MNRPSPKFNSAIFLLDLCTIKSFNLRHSVFLCPFHTKHFLVYTVICYLSKLRSFIKTKHHIQKCVLTSRDCYCSYHVYIQYINKHKQYMYFFICCVQIPPARSYCNKNSMRLCWGRGGGGTSVRAAFPSAHVISDTSWDHNPIRQMGSCLRSRERLPPLPVNTGSSWI